MQSFPQPPSAKEEKEYLKKCKEGNWQARNQLIERNMRLVAYIAKKYQQSGVEMEDLISIGTIGLIKGVDSFREDKKIRLATYCARCVENEILMYLRSVKKTARDVYLFDTIGSDKEGNEISLIDVLSSEKDSVIDKVEMKLQIKALYNKINSALTEREGEILKMRYGLKDGKCKTQREIAGMLGISRSYVSRIEKKALKKLKKELYPK